MLYTTYIDLRAAQLPAARLELAPRTAPVPAALPEGSDGLIEVTEGHVIATALSAEATAAGVELDQSRRPAEPPARSRAANSRRGWLDAPRG